jgi:hypothetical protein
MLIDIHIAHNVLEDILRFFGLVVMTSAGGTENYAISSPKQRTLFTSQASRFSKKSIVI